MAEFDAWGSLITGVIDPDSLSGALIHLVFVTLTVAANRADIARARLVIP